MAAAGRAMELEPTERRTAADARAIGVLVGTTASGKTAVALGLAERAGLELVSMDSMLVYRGLDVGTAKPTAAERARVAHHVIDVADPAERYTVQRWLADAEAAGAAIARRGARALFVGGTALYLKALRHGLFAGPPTDLALRAAIEARVEREGLVRLHAELAQVDGPSAARIHPHDKKRIVRALETWTQTGRPLSAWQREWSAEPSRALRIVGLHVASAELDRRIAERTAAMLAAGWADELAALGGLAALGPSARQALGYREIDELLAGRLDRDACRERIALRTRQFARRQRTWFRSFADIHWIAAPRGAGDLERAVDEAATALGA